MKKAYSYFKTSQDIKALGIQMFAANLFENIPPVLPTAWLLETLQIAQGIPANSEKAKSEQIISPILTDIRLRNADRLTFFSGWPLNVLPEKGLRGFCDFIISKKHNAVLLESPLLVVVEAKLNQDLPDALPQCIAEMYAAQIFNEQNNEPQPQIYGVVTSGYDWLFAKLIDHHVYVDKSRYFTANLPQLLGIWQLVLDSFER
ncbi:MAG: hypothetical protein JNM36_02575 [Chitinophagales bacterium]|nr:hypothetical protein [Chitinophagales bacterium]